ncbi:MAG: right-handed parallel beta-helix repeat-containing protein, partial [Geminicoccaceae bacterium]
GDRNGDGVGVTIDGADAQRILRTSGAGTEVALEALTLANGQVAGSASGGAVFVGGGSLALDGCTVRDSRSGYDGGGGGIFADQGSRVTVTNSTFSGNGTNGLYVFGGAIAGAGTELTVRHSTFTGNFGGAGGGAIALRDGSLLELEDSTITGNGRIGGDATTSGGGVSLDESTGSVARTTFADNRANDGGAISLLASSLAVLDSTIANNTAAHEGFYGSAGGGIVAFDGAELVVRNTTITGNLARVYNPIGPTYHAFGGGIFAGSDARLDIANSIVAGNAVSNGDGAPGQGLDLYGTITSSNGHNLFGSDVLGSVSGDQEGVAAAALFAAIDPATGGGLLSASGIVPLLDSIANPALSGADPLAASATGQLGGTPRPRPEGSLPDIGAIEINQPLSTTPSAHNDVLTGGNGANAIDGRAGADYIRGLGGKDTLHGGEDGDLLDGGAGNDRLYGDAGIDLVSYAGSTKVALDLATGKAVRGGESDTLHDVEGAIGSSRNDLLKGDGADNWFQGGLGKDTFTGKGGRDLYDYDHVAESRPGARDVIKDFAHLTDRIDLTGIDADTTVAGNQSFHWVGADALSGPGEVGFFTAGGNTIVQASTDADAASEFALQLTGIKALTAADFYL